MDLRPIVGVFPVHFRRCRSGNHQMTRPLQPSSHHLSMRCFSKDSSAAVIGARDGAGADTALMNDVNCPWSVIDAIEVYRKADLYRLEEPVWPPEDHSGLAR